MSVSDFQIEASASPYIYAPLCSLNLIIMIELISDNSYNVV
jgi:hypothetical protein